MQAIEKGAYDYLSKPFDLKELNKIIDRCISEKTRHDLDKDKNEDVSKFDLPIIGRSLQMQKVYKSIAKIVNTNLTVMISGESGTGKELIAKVLHDYGSRKNKPFIAINMAAIPKD